MRFGIKTLDEAEVRGKTVLCQFIQPELYHSDLRILRHKILLHLL